MRRRRGSSGRRAICGARRYLYDSLARQAKTYLTDEYMKLAAGPDK